MPGDARKSRKPLFFSLLFLTGAILLFAAGIFIFNNAEKNAAPYTPDQITAKVISDTKSTDLAKVDPALISKHYEIPGGAVTSSSLYMSKSSDSAAELNCFLLADASKYEALQSSVASHISTKAAGLKSLNPTQYSLLKNYLIVRHGRYVLVAVGLNADAERKAFQSIFE